MAEQDPNKPEAPPEVEDLLSPGFKNQRNTTNNDPCACSKKMVIIVIVVVTVLIVYGLGLGLGISFGLEPEENFHFTNVTVGAVVTDHQACSDVGRDVLQNGGSAVDAAIAALLCNGVRQPHSMGIGGGCFMVVYSKYPQRIDVINGREVAPARTASVLKNMSNSDASGGSVYTKRTGAKMIAVPGELKAYFLAHQRYGLLPWKDLFKPAIDMAKNGHPLSHSTARALRITGISVLGPGLGEIFLNDRGELKKEGDLVKMPKLAETLQGISEKGPEFIYNGSVGREIIKEIQSAGGILSEDDLHSYRVSTEPTLSFGFRNLTMHTAGSPSGGPIMGLVLKILSAFNLTSYDLSTKQREADTYHKMIEAFKFAYAHRSRMADPAFVDMKELMENITSENYAENLQQHIDLENTHNVSFYMAETGGTEDFGTSHISVLGPNGDAVSVTSTINYYFGSRVVSKSTGIIWNNEMADFDLKNTDSPNCVEPGKHPLSSMAPALFVDTEDRVRLILGSAGGTQIITTNSQVAARLLFLSEKLAESIEKLRFHHQLLPNKVTYEKGFPEDILLLLNRKGHITEEQKHYIGVAQGIYRDPTTATIQAVSDLRKKSGKASFLTWSVVWIESIVFQEKDCRGNRLNQRREYRTGRFFLDIQSASI
ncbi:hypothetical protein ScPMuIL_016693 [Solemya velum]